MVNDQLPIHYSLSTPKAQPMKKTGLLIFFLCLILNGFTQANWEYEFVKNVNPENPNSGIWKTFSASAKPIAVAVPLGLFAGYLITHDKSLGKDALETGMSVAISSIVTQSLKMLVERPRPYETHSDIYPDEIDNGYSFPSAHTSLAFSTATSIMLISKKWYYTVPAFAWATGVGYSRMYLGQHYPSDVFVGALVGAGGALASHWLTKKIFSGKNKKVATP
jgi:membrane-associated phospholipid phosphatase